VLTQIRTRLWSSRHLGAVAANQIDPLRIAQHFFNHFLNRPWHGCCVEEQLPGFRRTRKNFLRLRKKAHIQHSISFIKHTLLHERQRNGIKLAQFLDATGRSDQQVNANRDSFTLWRKRTLAVDGGCSKHGTTEEQGGLARYLLR
jgi:hypothetical protein